MKITYALRQWSFEATEAVTEQSAGRVDAGGFPLLVLGYISLDAASAASRFRSQLCIKQYFKLNIVCSLFKGPRQLTSTWFPR